MIDPVRETASGTGYGWNLYPDLVSGQKRAVCKYALSGCVLKQLGV